MATIDALKIIIQPTLVTRLGTRTNRIVGTAVTLLSSAIALHCQFVFTLGAWVTLSIHVCVPVGWRGRDDIPNKRNELNCLALVAGIFPNCVLIYEPRPADIAAVDGVGIRPFLWWHERRAVIIRNVVAF